MKDDFLQAREQIPIMDVARRLMGSPIHGLFRYPGEHTASVKIYERSRSFFDFGRNCGGDVTNLWSHVRRITNWEALKELRALYGIAPAQDFETLRKEIQAQEQQREAARQREVERRKNWIREMKFWKKIEMSSQLIASNSEPFSADWTESLKILPYAQYRLDDLCGLLATDGKRYGE